jgi:hypothetical protein
MILGSGSADFQGKELSFVLNLFQKFTESVDPTKLRVVNFPAFIFFCGGSIPHNSSPKGPFISVRHYILEYLKREHPEIANKIVLAETITDWFRGGFYKDLLTFEKDLAGLASAIVLFVESPGAIAELGVFSCIGEINEKLLVFVHEDHYNNEDSFIKLGPITYLEDTLNNPIYVYACKTYEKDGEYYIEEKSIKKESSDISKEIIAKVSNQPKGTKFDSNIPGHLILFISDLINIMRVIIIKDVIQVLRGFGLNIDRSDVQKYIFILRKMGLVVERPRGRNRYYVASRDDAFIEYGFRSGAYANKRDRWKFLFYEWYEEVDERKKDILERWSVED